AAGPPQRPLLPGVGPTGRRPLLVRRLGNQRGVRRGRGRQGTDPALRPNRPRRYPPPPVRRRRPWPDLHRLAARWAAADRRQAADGIALPNGMAVTADGSTLIVANSYGRELIGFDIGPDGDLLNRRVWAELGDGVPDGICADTEGAVWYADVPNQRCVRVREGGEVLETIELDRGCFACALGGEDGSTLFMMATEWRGPAGMFAEPHTGQVVTTQAPAPA